MGCNPSVIQARLFRNLVLNSLLRVCSCKVEQHFALVSTVPLGYKQVRSRVSALVTRGSAAVETLQPLTPKGGQFSFQKLKGPWVHSNTSSQLLPSTPLPWLSPCLG